MQGFCRCWYWLRMSAWGQGNFLSITSEGTKLCVYLLSSKLGLKTQSPFSGTRPELPWSFLGLTAKQTNKWKPWAVSRHSAPEIGCGYFRGVSLCSTYWCLFLNEDSSVLRLLGKDAQKTQSWRKSKWRYIPKVFSLTGLRETLSERAWGPKKANQNWVWFVLG